MRGTLIGSDYLKDNNSVKFLEINTNIAVHKDASEWLDTGSLMALLTSSNITDFHFIHNGNDSDAPYDTDIEYKFAKLLSASCASENITYHDHEVASGAITVPYIEDSDDKFILRQSYDNTAIIDSTYAADNFEFFELMSGSGYDAKVYLSSSLDDISIDTLDKLKTGSAHPNAIIKSRYPSYDINLYPAIYNFTDTSSIVSDLSNLKLTLPDDYLIQEFIDDEANSINNHWSVIRGIDILYGDNLDVLHLGGYKTSAYLPLDFSPISYSGSTQILDKKSKMMYNSKSNLTNQRTFHTDEETVVLKSDNTLVSGSELNIGDTIKTIAFELEVGTEMSGSIPVIPDGTEEFLDHYGYINDISGSIQYVSSSLISVDAEDNNIPLINLSFTDGTSIVDSPRASYLIEESGSNLTYFEHVNKFLVGDKICLVDSTTNNITTKEINGLSISWGNGTENVYNYDYEPYDHFLVNYTGNKFMISHNACTYCYAPWSPCGSYWCDNFCSPCSISPGGFK